MTDVEFQKIVTYVKNTSGIDLSQKRVLIKGRLTNYLVQNGYNSYNEYMNEVESDITKKKAEELINILTTNHTYFMREFEHLDFLRKVVLPELKEKEKNRRDLHIWCGASSTGEEPYTIAMVLKDFFGLEHNMWDTRVLATDLSTRVLEHAQKGIYLKEQIAPLPENWRRRYFKMLNQDEYQVKQELKNEVIFRQFNLMEPLPFKRPLHVVFLRNVMIYFDDETKRNLIDRIYDVMVPGGYLFIGASEALYRPNTSFKFVRPSVYRK